MVPVTTETRTERRSRRTRQKLMKSSLELFCEKGMDATSIAQITDKSDLGKGTFYRHFSSKTEVMAALTEDSVEALLQAVHGSVTEGMTLPEVLDALLNAHVEFFAAHESEFVLLFQSRMFLKTDREDMQDVEAPWVRYLEELGILIGKAAPNSASPSLVRRIACGLAGYVSGFISFARLGIGESERESGLGPLRKAFVSGLSELLMGQRGAHSANDASAKQQSKVS